MIILLIKIFFTGLFLNLIYELAHCVLYKTFLEAPMTKRIYLILKAIIFDGFAIMIIYFISYLMSKNFANTLSSNAGAMRPFYNYFHVVLFLVFSLLFAYLWEVYSIKNKRWEYSNKMPLVFGVGITPFVQLALTGFLSLYFAFNF